MISVSEAKAIIAEHSISLGPISFQLADAAGYTVSEDVYAKIDIPAFEQSSMDGYAIRFTDKDQALTVTGEMQAGVEKTAVLHAGEAYRIFTGAPLPVGADTVIMQEKVLIEDGQVLNKDPMLQAGSNVRNKGAEVRAGAVAVGKGTRLTPAALGFLAGIGLTHVNAYPPPSITIIATGKELQKPGVELGFGQVYESNSIALTAALKQAGVTVIQFMEADDDLQTLTGVLQNALLVSDMVLLTGGVSVGDYDFVVPASRQCDIEQLFHKIKQKPGKPLFFGRKEQKLVFGLPGNPSSVMSCFYNYVLPAIEKIMCKGSSTKTVSAKLTHGYKKVPGLTHFLKGTFSENQVSPLSAQESFRLSSFVHANCLIVLEEDHADYSAGEIVNVNLLPE